LWERREEETPYGGMPPNLITQTPLTRLVSKVSRTKKGSIRRKV